MNVEESWKIGDVEIPGKLILAPMAGVTDLPYRQICKEMGADLICTEMVSAKGIYYNSPNTQPLLEINPKERPVSLQLFGADPDIISEMAARIEELPFDILDINMGCPVPKVVNNGEGSALLKNIPLAEEIIRKTVRAIHKHCKISERLSRWRMPGSRSGKGSRGSRSFRGSGTWAYERAVLQRKSRL